MARLTILFLNRNGNGERKTLKTIEIVAKKIKSKDYDEAYYCHRNPYGINRVVKTISREYADYWTFSIEPLHTKDGFFMRLPSHDYIHVHVN